MDTVQHRKTIKEDLKISGIGLHSGKKVNLRLIPAESGTGLVFISNQASKSRYEIPVHVSSVVDTGNAVTLGDGTHIIQTIEHLMAALHTKGISDLYLELDSIEIPIMDGSAKPFVEALDTVETVDYREIIEPIYIKNPVYVVDGDKYLVILPSDKLKVTYHIDFPHPLLRGQTYTTELDSNVLNKEILPARTFGFLKDVQALQARGLALGGSLDNAVVLNEDGYLNNDLRYKNECVRHKVLDLIGDLSIIGRPIVGHMLASKAGHTLDISMAKLILSQVTGDEFTKFKSKRNYNFSFGKLKEVQFSS